MFSGSTSRSIGVIVFKKKQKNEKQEKNESLLKLMYCYRF